MSDSHTDPLLLGLFGEWRAAAEPPPCSCFACDGAPVVRSRMYLCAECGNKRCPHAADHRLDCSGSNVEGQEGSLYAMPVPRPSER